MSDYTEKFQKEWAVISGAPLTFIAAVAAATTFLGGVIYKIDSETLSAKDATIETLKTEIESYKEKLSGASPEEAKARFDALEAKVAKLEPRSLSAEKMATFSKLIKSLPPAPYEVFIVSTMSCHDCDQYAADLLSTFPQPPWSVHMGLVSGPGKSSPKGLTVYTPDPKNPLPEAAAIVSALTAANVPFDLMAGSREVSDPLFVSTPPKQITEILLTTPVSP